MEIMDVVGKVGNIVVDAGKQVGDVVSVKAQEVKDYAKDAMEVASLKNQINNLKDLVNQNYVTLGEFYFKKYEENPDADIVEVVEVISKTQDKITELENKIDEIKSAQAELKAAKEAAEAEAVDLAEEAKATGEAVDDELAKVKENVSDDNSEE